jgi:ATP phosphoribosyltransferase
MNPWYCDVRGDSRELAVVKYEGVTLGLPSGRFSDWSRRIARSMGVEFLPRQLSARSADGLILAALLKPRDLLPLFSLGYLSAALIPSEWVWEQTDLLLTGTYDILIRFPGLNARLAWLTWRGEPAHDFEPEAVATPFPNIASSLLSNLSLSSQPRILLVAGSVEGLVPWAVDTALDIVETGVTAAANNLYTRFVHEDPTSIELLVQRDSRLIDRIGERMSAAFLEWGEQNE